MHLSTLARTAGVLGLVLVLAVPGSADPGEKKGEQKWGTVKGRVTWAGGVVPNVRPEEYVVNPKNKGVKNVFVWLMDASDPKAPKAPPVNPAVKLAKEVDLTVEVGPPRRVEPHVLALHAGQTVVLKNDTPAADNIGLEGDEAAKGGRFPLAAKATCKTKLGASRKVVVVNSALNAALRGYIKVFDHPYFAVTDADGRYEIKDAPAGKYNIVIWQEGMGWVNGGKLGRAIDIPAEKAIEIDAEVKPWE